MGGFSLPNLTLGGGSEWTQQLMQLLDSLGQQRNVRAGLGQDLFGQLLGAQLEANRRPISLVDQLLLSGQVGSTSPLSQAGQEQIGRYTSRPQSNLLGDLQRRLEMFSIGALTPTQQVQEGFAPDTGIRLSDQQRRYIEALARGTGREPGRFADEPRQMQYGGRMRIDPSAPISTRTTAAGPASVIDRTGRPVALLGEAGRAETMNVTGQAKGTTGGGTATTFGGEGQAVAQDVEAQRIAKLRPDERIRYDEITRLHPELPFQTRLSTAQRPGDFEQWVGQTTDPRAAGARLIGGAISGDTRFSPGLLRSLALGRAPSPGELTARDFASLPPDIQDSLASVIGPDLMRQFLFELSNFTPQGRRTSIAGPVAA